MTDDTAPFFIRPYRFDDPDPGDDVPRLDWRDRIVPEDDERTLWQGSIELSGLYADPTAEIWPTSWTLARPAHVLVTDRRLAYVCADWARPESEGGPDFGRPTSPIGQRRSVTVGSRVVAGQLRWQWPRRLCLAPAEATAELVATGPTEHLVIVCDSLRSARRPALALAGGSIATPRALRELAVLIRRAVAAFRLHRAAGVELSPPERDSLRALAGTRALASEHALPGRGMDLPGALPVEFLHGSDYYRRPAQRPIRGRRVAGSGSPPDSWTSYR
jgi:hypothetical protein